MRCKTANKITVWYVLILILVYWFGRQKILGPFVALILQMQSVCSWGSSMSLVLEKLTVGQGFLRVLPFSVSTVPPLLCALIGTGGQGLGTFKQSSTLLDVENRGTEVSHCWFKASEG